jgi:hypothetical protein
MVKAGEETHHTIPQSGMEIVDIDRRRWLVRSIRRTGRGESLLIWLLSHAFSTLPSRIEHELEEKPPISLDEVKGRVCANIVAFPQDYSDIDDHTAETIEAVRTARSAVEIHDLLGLDGFMAY